MSTINSFICQECDKICISSQGLKNHITKKHKKENEDFLSCHICNKIFSSTYSRLRHEAKCEEKKMIEELKNSKVTPASTIVYNITNNYHIDKEDKENIDLSYISDDETEVKIHALDNLKITLKNYYVEQPYKYILQDPHNIGVILKEHLAPFIVKTNENNLILLDDDKNKIILTYKEFVDIIKEEFSKYDCHNLFFLFLISPCNYSKYNNYYESKNEATNNFINFSNWLEGDIDESYEQKLIQILKINIEI